MNSNIAKKGLFKSVPLRLLLTYIFMWGSTVSRAADFPVAGDIAAGSITWAENCTRCHNLRAPNELRDDQWITSIFHMRVRAGLTGQETRDVLTFLQAANSTSEQAQVQSDIRAVAQQDIEKIEK